MLRLQEVIWEITPECDKGCDYCGSKDILNNECLAPNDLKVIAKSLADYDIEEVNLSGGEPGVLACNDPETFNEVLRILTKSGMTKVKVVSYGKILDADIDFDMISVCGFSINDAKDIDAFSARKNTIDLHNHTMITNFGNHNVWEFDKLLRMAKNFGCWQVQLTMGKYQLSPEGIKYLRGKLSEPMTADEEFAIVMADNLQLTHECTAGMRSCGVTYTGDVIACLSERSYGPCTAYGNLLKSTMKEIWENGFKDCRFNCGRKCCRDHIAYPGGALTQRPEWPVEIELPDYYYPAITPQTVTMMYMVQTPPHVMAYAVIPPTTKTTIYTGDKTVKPVYAVTRPPRRNRRGNDWGTFDDGGDMMMYGVFGGW